MSMRMDRSSNARRVRCQGSAGVLGLLVAFAACQPAGAFGQDANASAAAKAQYSKVIGSIVSIAPDGSKITVKPDTGSSQTDVALDANTSYLQVPPGEKDLRKATRIELKDLAEGDRVYARSRITDGQGIGPAVSVIVMSKTQLAQHQQAASEEWQKRGVAGRVTAVDPANQTLTVRVQGPGGAKMVTVHTAGDTQFRRYSPDSIRFADAKKSAFGDIEPGDNIRVLGNRSEDGDSMQAEQVVTGVFRNVAGTVISVDAADHSIRLNDLITKQPVTVLTNADTNLRRLPQYAAMAIARYSQNAGATAGTPGATPGPTAHEGQGGPGSRPGFNGPGAPNAIAQNHPGATETGPAGAGAGGRGRMDLNQILERSPKLELSELEPGDALFLLSTKGSDPSRVLAVTVVAGVEPILAATSAGGSRNRGSVEGEMWNLDMSIPQ